MYDRDFGFRGPERIVGRGPGGGYRYDRSMGRGMPRYDAPMRGGMPRYDTPMRRGGSGYDAGMPARSRYDSPMRGYGRGEGRYGGDYWWIGEHAMRGYHPSRSYDDSYRRYGSDYRPRFSPVGGMYPAMGGYSSAGHVPPQLREYRHFSDWTRWF
jgi:hypothetical protein